MEYLQFILLPTILAIIVIVLLTRKIAQWYFGVNELIKLQKEQNIYLKYLTYNKCWEDKEEIQKELKELHGPTKSEREEELKKQFQRQQPKN